MKIDFQEELDFQPEEAPKGAQARMEDSAYQEYLSSVKQRQNRTSIPGAEGYDKAEAMSFEDWKKARDTKSRNKQIGMLEAGASFLTGIPATMIGGLAGFTAPVNPLTKRTPEEFFGDVTELLTYVPRTDEGQSFVNTAGHALQAFPPVGAYVSSPAMRSARAKKPSIEERIAEVKQEAAKQPEAVVPEESKPFVVDSAGNAMRPEDLMWRDRAQQQQIDALRPVDDEQVRMLEEAVSESAQRKLERRQAELEDQVRLATARSQLEQNNASKLESQPTGYAEWVEMQRQAANTRIPGNNDPLDLGPKRLTKADQYPDINDFPNLLQEAPYQYEGALDPGINAQRALPVEIADMLRTGDRTPDPFARVSTRQNANRMAQPLEDHIAALNRSEALPEDIARFEGEGGVNSGMSRGQRGAINTKMFNWRDQPIDKDLKPLGYPGYRLKIQTSPYGPELSLMYQGEEVGSLYGRENTSRGNLGPDLEVGRVAINPEHRGKGLTNLMYDVLSTLGNDIVRSKVQLPDGKAMWDKWEQSGKANQGLIPKGGFARTQRGAIDLEALGFKSGDSADKLVKDLLGKKFFTEPPKAENIIADAIKDGKDSKQSINFSAGATLQAMKTKSPLIQGVGRIVQGFKNRADNTIRETVFPVEDSFRKLSKTEVEEVAAVLKDEMFTREKLTAEQVDALGLTDKQLLAYQKLRTMLKSAYEDQNNARIAAGKAPITEAEYYMSSRWQGDFRIPLKDKDGNLAWYVAADNKWQANKHADAVAKQFGLTKGDMSVVKSSRRGGEMGNDLYISMVNVLGKDNPMVKEIKNWLETSTSEEAAAVRGQLKHFQPKNNTRGFVGDRLYKSASAEALDLIQSQINYAKNAHYWAEMQRAGAEVKKVLADETLNQTQPRNMNYARQYWLDQVGFNESKVIKALEDSIRNMGISPNQLGRGINNVKNLWVMQKLAVNLGFMASNVMQFGATLPHLLDLQRQYGGNPVTSLINGMLTGTMMATGHKTQQNPKFYKAVAMSPGDNKFLLEAMRYAEDNSVIARSIYDESPIASSFSPYANAMNFAGKTISTPETYLRSIVFMSYAHQLKSSGKFKDNMNLFREAEERTNASMGDYREGERALVFSKLGQLGNAANTLQTFPMNYFNQWSWAAREAGRGNPIPAVTMFAMQAYLAGMMGIPLFSELDRGLELIKDWLSSEYPQAWAKVKDFNLKEQVLSLPFGEEILYGPLSTQTGLGLTSRAAAPVPSEMVQTPFAPAVDMGTQAVQAGKAILDPLDEQKRAQALMSMSPTGVQGFLETGPMKDQVAGEFNPETGTTTYGKIRDMAAREATVERTPEEENIRKYGFRAQSEVVRKDLEFITGKRAAQTRNVIRELPDKIYNEARKADKDKVKELVQLYVELGGTPTELTSGLNRQVREELLVPSKRGIAVQKPTLATVQQYKILQDTLKELGYVD